MRARILGIAAVLAIALLLVAGADAGGTSPTKIDLSSPAAIDAYLRSVGVDPATVVKQAGLRNYAGPSCPGLGWNCTTAVKVVQVATPGGENKFECEPEEDQVLPPGPPGPPFTDEDANTCVIAQAGDTNKARCKLGDTEPTTTQTCDIGQDGKRNSADIDMTIEQKDGPEQSGEQIARVDQTATERNQSQIHQTVKQQTSTDTSQTQDAYQLADVQQSATGSDNFSHVHQSQDQDESGNATTQNQNIALQPGCVFKNANQCARVGQHVSDPDGGKNESHLHQAIGERQSTKAPSVQTQGDLTNGNEGDIHQDNPPGLGQNQDHAHQVVAQRQAGPNGTTTQRQETDPRCCGDSQVGGEENREDINQATTQSASEDDAVQASALHGEAHQISEEDELTFAPTPVASPDNKCRIDQEGRNNSGGDHFSSEGEGAECIDLFRDTTCTSGPSIDITTAQDETPPCESFGSGDVDSFVVPATFGSSISMPDYNSEPAEYVDPGGWW